MLQNWIWFRSRFKLLWLPLDLKVVSTPLPPVDYQTISFMGLGIFLELVSLLCVPLVLFDDNAIHVSTHGSASSSSPSSSDAYPESHSWLLCSELSCNPIWHCPLLFTNLWHQRFLSSSTLKAALLVISILFAYSFSWDISSLSLLLSCISWSLFSSTKFTLLSHSIFTSLHAKGLIGSKFVVLHAKEAHMLKIYLATHERDSHAQMLHPN